MKSNIGSHQLGRGRVIAAAIASLLLGSTAVPVAQAQDAKSDGKAADGKAIVMKIATGTLNDPQHEWMKRMAAKLGPATGGRIAVELYPSNQLGSIPRQIEGTQLGSIQAWAGAPEFMFGIDPRFELMSAPGLFKNLDHVIRAIKDPELNKAFLSLGANKGLVGAALYFTGPMTFVSRTPIKTIADFKGKKIRVLASPMQTEQVSKLGGTGIPIPLGDVLPALQQGTIDGAMSGIGVFTPLQYYDAAKYLVETGHANILSVSMISKRWLDGLPPDLRQIVLDLSHSIGEEVLTWGVGYLDQQRKTWVEKGGQINPMSEADLEEIRSRTASVGDDVTKGKPELRAMYDLVVAAAKRTQ